MSGDFTGMGAAQGASSRAVGRFVRKSYSGGSGGSWLITEVVIFNKFYNLQLVDLKSIAIFELSRAFQGR